MDTRNKKMILILALAFPVTILIGIAGINAYYLKVSHELVLPIEGYDPRDLLSGRYLQYRVLYGVKCPAVKKKRVTAYLCLEPAKRITLKGKPEQCSLFIKGKCSFTGRDFRADVDRYYISEKSAKQLERLFMNAKDKKVVLSVTKRGQALAKDLLIDGQSIKIINHYIPDTIIKQ